MKPMKRRAMTILIFHSASAATRIPPATSVTVAARRAVVFMCQGFSPFRRTLQHDAGRSGGTGLRRRPAARDRARAPADALDRAGRRRDDRLRRRLASLGAGGRAARRRRGGRARGGLEVGPDARRPHVRQAVRGARAPAQARGGRAARQGVDGRGRAVLPRPRPRLRDARRGRARDQRGAAAAGALRPRPAAQRLALYEHTFAGYNGRREWLPTLSLSTAPASTTSRTSPSG